jgi:hypothetical protein
VTWLVMPSVNNVSVITDSSHLPIAPAVIWGNHCVNYIGTGYFSVIHTFCNGSE